MLYLDIQDMDINACIRSNVFNIYEFICENLYFVVYKEQGLQRKLSNSLKIFLFFFLNRLNKLS